jgi:hypothetical protein
VFPNNEIPALILRCRQGSTGFSPASRITLARAARNARGEGEELSNVGFRVFARNPIFHDCVEATFRRALWNRQDARLKAGATQTKAEFSNRLFSPWGLGLATTKRPQAEAYATQGERRHTLSLQSEDCELNSQEAIGGFSVRSVKTGR